MLSRHQAQVGNTIYGGVTQAPNQGQVSALGAQGYIKRELRNKKRSGVLRQVGKDGKSDSRSAVAASALGRMRKTQGSQRGPEDGRKKFPGKGKKGGGYGGPGDGRRHPSGKGGPGGPGPFGGPDDGRTHNFPNGEGPVGDEAVGTPGSTAPTQVQVTEDGILQLPYNQEYSAEQLAAITGANEQLLGLKAEGDQQALEYGQGKRQTQLAYDSLKRQTLNQNAAEGTAFSSRYGTSVANNAAGYANQIGDLEAANTGFLQNQKMQQAAIQSSLNQQLAALAQQYADDLNDEAGGLGYGQDEKPLPKDNKERKAEQRQALKEKNQRIRERNRRRRQRQRNKKKGGKK